MPPSPRPARPRAAARQTSARRQPASNAAPRRSGERSGVLAFLPFRQSRPAIVPLRRDAAANPFNAPSGSGPFALADGPEASPETGTTRTVALFGTDGELLSLSNERQELLCSVIGLMVKFGLVAVAGVSLFRLAGAYQQRMERQGEISAVLELQNARMAKARERFDDLFMVEGEQRLLREQSQWIAPDRLRIVWQNGGKPFPTVETAAAAAGKGTARP